MKEFHALARYRREASVNFLADQGSMTMCL
jgi:hypothetical protein